MLLAWPFFFSVILPAVYFLLYVWYVDHARIADRISPTTGRALLELEYNVLNDGVMERTNWVLLSGTLFITISTILLAQGATNTIHPRFRELLVVGSWSIYSIWLFLFYLADARYAAVTRSRLQWIEGHSALKINANLFMKQHRVPIRPWVWFILLNVLLAIGNVIVGNGNFLPVNLFFILLAAITDILIVLKSRISLLVRRLFQ